MWKKNHLILEIISYSSLETNLDCSYSTATPIVTISMYGLGGVTIGGVTIRIAVMTFFIAVMTFLQLMVKNVTAVNRQLRH